MSDIVRVPDHSPVKQNDCHLREDSLSLSFSDRAAAAFAWAIALGVLFLSTAAVLINIFRREKT
jgi:hypothetical protein